MKEQRSAVSIQRSVFADNWPLTAGLLIADD